MSAQTIEQKDKTWVFRQMAKKVVSIEPDGTCFAALQTRYGRDKGFVLENIALGDRAGVGTFFRGGGRISPQHVGARRSGDWLVSIHKQNIRKVSVPVANARQYDCRKNTERWIFLKIDVEGGELSVVKRIEPPCACYMLSKRIFLVFGRNLCGIIERFRSQ